MLLDEHALRVRVECDVDRCRPAVSQITEERVAILFTRPKRCRRCNDRCAHKRIEIRSKPRGLVGFTDGFLARLGPDGKTLWTRGMGGEGDDIADTVAIDPKGNPVVAGSFSKTLGLGEDKMESKGSDDMFVAAIDKDGRRLWGRRFGGPDSDGVDGIAVDRAGNIAVIGSYRSEMEVAKDDLFSQGDVDIVLIMLAPDGTPLWGRGWGSMGPDEGRAVAFDKDGNLVVLVEFSRSIDFGGGPLTSAGNRDLGVIKLDPSGKHVWSRRFGGQLDELAVSLAVDPAGSVAMTGSFDDVLDFGDGAPLHTAGRSDGAMLGNYLITGPDLLRNGRAPESWPLDRPPFYLETNVPGLFAAGDVRHGSVKRCASAVGEGAMAVTFAHRYLADG